MRHKNSTGVVLLAACLSVSALLVGCQVKSEQDEATATNGAISTSPASRPQRYSMVIGLKPEKIDYYKELHANPWPGVLKQISQSGIQNYSIHLVELKPNEFYLFGYLEYTGNDFESDMAAMAEDAETIRWWKETDPCQYPIETAKAGDKWTMMEEVFFHP